MSWLVVYESAERSDGSLFFPERLSREFLRSARIKQGSMIYANQYLNEIISAEDQIFRQEWFKYYESLPQNHYTFIGIDPAISQKQKSDYTGIVVAHVDTANRVFYEVAKRVRVTPTQLVSMIFELNSRFRPQAIGVETIAYQEALIYMIDEEMRRRKEVLPIKSIKYGPDESKKLRIMGLAPKFEWGRRFLNQGLTDFEDELVKFPRAAYDDIADAAAIIEKVSMTPEEINNGDRKPNPAKAEDYEEWYRKELAKKSEYKGYTEYEESGGDFYE